jgi:hypothetical protein
MATEQIRWCLHDGLIARLDERAAREGRNRKLLVEQALAEYLDVPLAHPDLPEQPVEMCPECERGIIHDGRCLNCRWWRRPRAWKKNAPPVRTRARLPVPKLAK